MERYHKLNKMSVPISELRTGDVLLFAATRGFITRLISRCTDSIYTHAAVVIRDPQFPNFTRKGVYMMESTTLDPIPDAEDGIKKFGVQIHLLERVVKTYPGKVYVRKLHTIRNERFYERVNEFHRLVHNEPYDLNPLDWTEMALKKYYLDRHVKTEFICSALVCFFLVVTNSLDPTTPWTLIRPVDLGQEAVKRYPLEFSHGVELEDTKEIIVSSE